MRRRFLAAGLVAFVIFVVAYSVVPRTWSSSVSPPGQSVHSISYRCGAAFGSSYVHGPTPVTYVTGTPCSDRKPLQIMTTVDVVLGVTAIVFMVSWVRGRRRIRITEQTV